MNPDILAIHHRQRARRTGQSPAEYASAIQGFRRRTSTASRVAFALAVILLLAAAALRLS